MLTTTVRDQILAEAERLRGIPYRMVPPPDGVNTLDCSLFVWTALRNAGLPFPPGVRTAEQIRQACVPISFDDVEPGDLLFFEHTYEPDAPHGPDGRIASHVGLSLGKGTRRMWDCHESDEGTGLPGVGVTDISTPYWQEKLFEARRSPRLVGSAGGNGQVESNPGGSAFRLITDGVRLRAQPGTSQPILIENLGAGTVVTAVDDQLISRDNHQWRHVRTADGTVGFVAAEFLGPVGVVPPGILSIADLYALVRSRGAEPVLDRIMVAGALTESGGNPRAIGDNGHSAGLWQMHDAGLGAGMTLEQRMDPVTACDRMLPEYRSTFLHFSAQGLDGEDLAAQTYLFTERPFQFDTPGSDADVNFRSKWRQAVI
jgi:hypothetical protein